MSAAEVVEDVVDVAEDTVDLMQEHLLIPKGRLAFWGFVAFGAAVGAAYGSYKYGVQKTQAKYEQVIKEEIAAAKAFYKQINKEDEFETPEKAVAHLHPVPQPNLEEAVEALNKYQGKVEEEVEVEKSVNIFVERTPDDDNFDLEKEMESRTPDAPYVISAQEFMEAEPGYDQITITYYQGDGTLADDKDEEIPYADPIVGEASLTRFGHGSGDNRIVYVRNERMETDFEILLSDGKYAHEVLGFEHSDGGPRARRLRNQPRKFRGEGE